MDERKKGEWGGRPSDDRADAPAPIADLTSFRAAAGAYGGDLAHWPIARRAEAETLLGRGGETAAAARKSLEDEAAFDAFLDTAFSADASLSEAQIRRFMAGAERARLSFAERLAYAARDALLQFADRLGEQFSVDRGLRVSTADLRFGSFGGLGAAAAVAGLVFGLYGPMADASASSQTASGETFVFEGDGAAEDEIDFFVQDLAMSGSTQEMDG